MVWGGIAIGRRSELMVIRRDMDSKREGYTANSYVDTLSYALPDIL